MFVLHQQLQKDCIALGQFSLCLLLLMNDANYPWFILVPQRNNLREIFDLSEEDQGQLMRESSQLARALATCFKADKINIAALGNVVSQLHVHHIVRYTHDPVWPAPVWGKLPAIPYQPAAVLSITDKLKTCLGEGVNFRI